VTFAYDGQPVFLRDPKTLDFIEGKVLVAAGDFARVEFGKRGITIWIAVDYLYCEADVAMDAEKRLGGA